MGDKSILFLTFGNLKTTMCLRALQLSKYLKELGWQTIVAASQEHNPGGLPCEFKMTYGNDSLIFYDTGHFSFFNSSLKLITKTRPTLVHMLNPREKAVLLAGRLRTQRFIFDWEDWDAFSASRSLTSYRKRLRDRFLVTRADFVVTASAWLRDYIRNKYGVTGLYLPYAILPREFPELTNLPSEKIAVGMGTLHPWWDHDLLIEACAYLARSGREPQVKWIGDGPDANRAKAKAKNLGLKRFSFAGFLEWEEMLREIQSAHTLVFPIRRKPLNLARCPFKCYQFAQARRPVITSDVGEVKSILGDLAEYVEPEPDVLGESIHRALSRPRQPDVPYDLSKHSWAERAATLHKFLSQIAPT
jgi:glycosyltransferase involved in cell wall biosynthesis